MKQLMMSVLAAALLCPCFVGTVAAQDEKQKSQLIQIHTDYVKPSMVAQYEKASAELAALFKEHNFSQPSIAVMQDDFTYMYITPLDGFANIDQVVAAWGEMSKAAGEGALSDALAKFNGCYDVHEDTIIRLRNDISYNPGHGMADQVKDLPYRNWNYYYAIPGMESKVEEVAKEWHALFTKHDVAEGYRIYNTVFGGDYGLYVVVESAASPSAYAATQEARTKKFGDEGNALQQKTMALMRHFETKTGWMRPDLSYQPPAPTSELSAN